MDKKIIVLTLIIVSVFATGCNSNQKKQITNENSANSKSDKNITQPKNNKIDTAKEQQQTAYTQYTNDRFGFSIEYPSTFGVKLVPNNDDGRVFSSTDDSTELSVWGINSDNKSPETVYGDYLKNTNNPSYKKQEGNWFVISWTEGNKIVYQKSIVGSGSINTFIIKYPIKQRNYYDSIISHLNSSFKTPGINSTH